MHGVSEIQRRNAGTPFAQQPGAYTARAIEVAANLSATERNIFNQRGVLPPIVVYNATRDGFDDALLVVAVREALPSFAYEHAQQAEDAVRRNAHNRRGRY